MLLTLAEAENEVNGPTAEVYSAINEIRTRAGQPNLPTGLSKDEMRKRIRHERRVELACEGLRWNDLCRWKAGKLLENIKTYLGPRDPATGEYRVVYPGMTRTWYDRLYLYPIPTDEFTYNPNLLPQNPGWTN